MLDCDGNHVMGMSLFEVLLVWVTLPAPWCNYQIPHFMEQKHLFWGISGNNPDNSETFLELQKGFF